MIAAASAGFVSATLTNPIWFVKTRLQLDLTKYGETTTLTCIKSIYNETGIKGFYKGITASYFGISETILHFIIYENIKSKLRDRIERNMDGNLDDVNAAHILLQSMIAGAFSKTFASIIAYPHGKVFFNILLSVSSVLSIFNSIYLNLILQKSLEHV